MPRLRTKQEMADITQAFALTYGIVEYAEQLYMPVDFLTSDPLPSDPNKTVWMLLTKKKLRGIANLLLHILFASDPEERSFRLMLRQFATQVEGSTSILVRYKEERVMLLLDSGELAPATGDFVPNYLDVPYDPETPLVEELWTTLVEWLNSEDQAHSLLYHLATALQPSWSAVKYILLIGEGRNGKGTLLRMINDLFGPDNISNATRQHMAAQAPLITDMNGKLLNIVFDGPKSFVKDSFAEKTILAGEPLTIELKYENAPYTVQTNALFIEGLNEEPQSSDKTPALQKRLVRFLFSNTYDLDLKFAEKMHSPEMLAAFLHLLLEHWVNMEEVADKLQLTVASLDLQMNAVWVGSPLLRFLEATSTRDSTFLPRLVDKKTTVDIFLYAYRTWMDSNGYKNVEDDYLLRQLKEHFTLDRKTFRIEGKATTRRYIKGIKADTMNAINVLMEGGTLSSLEEDSDILEDDADLLEGK